MKKAVSIIAAVLIVAGIIVLLTGCEKQEEPDNRFITVDREVHFEIVVDTETGIEYFRQYNGGVCQLIDSYGNPYIYPGFDAREDRP